MADKPKFFQLVLSLMIGALIFLTALAWNNVARKTAQKHFKGEDDIKGFTIYAVIMTSALILIGWISVNLYPDLAMRLSV